MKKFLLSVSAIGFLFCCISCNNGSKGGLSAAAKKNLDASHIVSDAFMSGDVSKINDAVATDFVDHTDMGDKKGPDSLKAMITTMKKTMPDMKMKLIKEVADDDYVFSEMEFTGTSNGEMGMPPGPYDVHGIEVVKFKDGKAIEHWEYMRNDDVMKMIANMPKPPAMAADTTGKKK